MSIERAIEYLKLALTELEGSVEKPTEKPIDNLESIYSLYPRKMGKSRGMKTLKKLKQDSYKDLRAAVINYRNYVIQQELEPKYIKLWSTFANEWEDWIEPPMVINAVQERRRIQKEKLAQQRMHRDREPTKALSPEEKERNKIRLQALISSVAKNMED